MAGKASARLRTYYKLDAFGLVLYVGAKNLPINLSFIPKCYFEAIIFPNFNCFFD